jgi:hypothetical protein
MKMAVFWVVATCSHTHRLENLKSHYTGMMETLISNVFGVGNKPVEL